MKNSKYRFCPFKGLMLTTVALLTAVILVFSASTLLVSCSGGDTPQKVVDPTPTPTPTPTPDPNQPNNPNNPTNPDQPSQPDHPTVPTIPENVEIGIKAFVGQFQDAARAGTRSTTYYDISKLLESEGFYVYAYLNTDFTYISTTVNYSSSQWRFGDGVHYWPPSGNLDFLAHVPQDISGSSTSYITGFSYNSGNPTFNCVNLPVLVDKTGPVDAEGDPVSLKEFLYAYAPGLNEGNSGEGVTMNFHHPFACITFKNGKAKTLKIESVTFESIYNNGIYSYNNGSPLWTPSGSTISFVGTYDYDYYSDDMLLLGGPYLVVPQNGTVTLSVDTEALDWGGTAVKDKEYSVTIPINWQPGYSYVYTFNIVNGDLVVNTEIFTEQW